MVFSEAHFTNCPFCNNGLKITAAVGGHWNIYCSKKPKRDDHYFGFDQKENRFLLRLKINSSTYEAVGTKDNTYINKINFGKVHVLKDCDINKSVEYLQNLKIMT